MTKYYAPPPTLYPEGGEEIFQISQAGEKITTKFRPKIY